jgi:hypothetical protein
MCSNDSPSVKPDGTTDAAELAATYEEFLLDIEEQPLPEYRTDELRARIEEVRATLAVEGVASAGQLQQLLRTATEALADVRAARVVSAPTGRDLANAVPGATDTGAAYEVTETEQQQATNVLIDLLFTIVETPTHTDRRRREEPPARDDGARDAHDNDAREAHDDDARDTHDDDARDDTRDDARDTRDGAHSTDAEDGTDFGVTGYAGPE